MYFYHSHILFSLLNKCPRDFIFPHLQPFRILLQTLSLNLATKYGKVLTFIYSPKDCFFFQDKLHLEQFLLFNPCNYFDSILQYLFCVRNWVTSWTMGPAKTPGILLHPGPFLTKSMVQSAWHLLTVNHSSKISKDLLGTNSTEMPVSAAVLSYRQCPLHLVQWQEIACFELPAHVWHQFSHLGCRMVSHEQKPSAWDFLGRPLCRSGWGGFVENLLQCTLPNCFMFALCCPLGRNLWISNMCMNI